jgi:hypothetical protein
MKKFLLYLYTTFIFKPLAGGNGVIQMDEMAKAVLLIMIVRSSLKEEKAIGQVFPDVYWICIFGAVCAIAAIKPAFSKKDVVKDTPAPKPLEEIP